MIGECACLSSRTVLLNCRCSMICVSLIQQKYKRFTDNDSPPMWCTHAQESDIKNFRFSERCMGFVSLRIGHGELYSRSEAKIRDFVCCASVCVVRSETGPDSSFIENLYDFSFRLASILIFYSFCCLLFSFFS